MVKANYRILPCLASESVVWLQGVNTGPRSSGLANAVCSAFGSRSPDLFGAFCLGTASSRSGGSLDHVLLLLTKKSKLGPVCLSDKKVYMKTLLCISMGRFEANP